MTKRTEKSHRIRKEERECLEGFFNRHIRYISDNGIKCLNCGVKLLGHVSEVAHILPKGTYKSVQCDDDNAVYLCGFLQNNCHGNFDNLPTNKVAEMKCFPYIVEKFKLIKDKVEEPINFKIIEKYESNT